MKSIHLVLLIAIAGLLSACGTPFAIVHNADGTTTITPPPVIVIPSQTAK